MLGDNLYKLPTTRINHDDPNDLKLLEEIFPPSEKINTICITYLDIIISGILFFLIGLPLTTKLIQKFSSGNSEMGVLFIKTVIFIILLFFINNIYLIKLN